jgi:electron transfer flavoprotein alpha/beta subunit
MNIIVPIKQVPDTAAVHFDPQTHTLVREGVASIISPFDENAIEEGLRLREQHGGEVTVLSMGPPQAVDALRQALAMGADRAVLLSDPAFAGADTLATSYVLSLGVRHLGAYDIILCGRQAFDGDTGQVGPGLAENLGIPQATFALEITVDGPVARVKRVLDDRFEIVQLPLPCLVTVIKQINDPRHAGLKGVMKARKAEIPTLTAADLGADLSRCGLQGSALQVLRTFAPERTRKSERLEGEPAEVAAALVGKLRADRLL